MKRRTGIICTLLLLCLLLTGCRSGGGEESGRTEQGVESGSPAAGYAPAENLSAVGYDRPIASPQGAVYGKKGDTVVLYDLTTGESFPLCFQSGCTHSEESCPAWLGEDCQYFAPYRGLCYGAVPAGEGDLALVECDPEEGGRRTVCLWELEEPGEIACSEMYLAYGSAYLRLTWWETQTETSWESWERVDLTTGACTRLLKTDDWTSCRFMAAGEETLVMQASVLDALPQNLEDWLAQGGSEEDYLDYLEDFSLAHQSEQLRVYDLETMEHTLLADSREGFRPTVDPHVSLDDRVVYQVEDSLYLYDLGEGESRLLLTQGDIINYWLADEKVFYIVCRPEEDTGCDFYYQDLSGQAPVRLENGGDRAVMRVNTDSETPEGFVARLDGETVWITKEDFYAERYEKALRLG